MALQRIQLARHSYVDPSLPISAQRLVNFYGEQKPEDAKSNFTLIGTPGLRPWNTLGTGPIRGMLGMGPHLFVVSGTQCWRIDQFGTANLAGSVTGTSVCSMATDGFRVVIVSDFDIYYATATGFGQLPISDCVGVAVHDGYFLFAERNSQKFFISDIEAPIEILGVVQPPTFDATEFVLVNSYPDNNTAIINSNRETWIFGERSAQIYYDSGSFDFPFSRMSGGVLQRGCLATRSVAEFQGTIFWLGDDKRIYASQGAAPMPISTTAIDAQLAGYMFPEAAVGFCYSQNGHVFYALTFNETTWVFDATEKLWHERQSRLLANWRAWVHEDYFGRLLVGDRLTNNLCELDLELYEEFGEGLIRTATFPPLFAGGMRATMGSVYIDMEVGVGLITGQGSNPRLMLDWSDDGGFTYGSELSRTIGAIGSRRSRVQFQRLGQFQQRTLRIRVSDPVKCSVIQAFADIEVGAS